MTLQERLAEEMKEAMKANEKLRLSTSFLIRFMTLFLAASAFFLRLMLGFS